MVLKVGIIGVGGRIGSQLEEDKLRVKPATHIGAFMGNSECEVEAVCDVDVAKLKKVMKKWKVPYLYADYRKMLKLHGLDIIVICTPTETHAIIFYEAVKQGSPLIFCEKPLAHNLEAAKEMVRVACERDITLAVNHTRRWDPIYRHAKGLIEDGKVGEVTRILGYASREKDFEGNIHMFDVLSWFSNKQPELCTYVDCHPSQYLIFEVDVVGTKGRILIMDNGRILEFFVSGPSRHYRKINELVSVKRWQPQNFGRRRVTPLMRAVMDIVDCADSGKQPLCTGEDGLNALQMYYMWRKQNSE